jgi:hypothetical protein
LNIVFLCGSLQPGRDGVGVYTRRLAGEVIRQGHQASIISLTSIRSLFVSSEGLPFGLPRRLTTILLARIFGAVHKPWPAERFVEKFERCAAQRKYVALDGRSTKDLWLLTIQDRAVRFKEMALS